MIAQLKNGFVEGYAKKFGESSNTCNGITHCYQTLHVALLGGVATVRNVVVDMPLT
jgi:hypothetical protein